MRAIGREDRLEMARVLRLHTVAILIVLLIASVVAHWHINLMGGAREGLHAPAFPSASEAGSEEAWKASIGPWVPLTEPGRPRYYDDGGWSDAAWGDVIGGLVVAGGAENNAAAVKRRAGKVPEVAVRAALEDMAREMDPATAAWDPRGMRPVRWSVRESEAVGDGVWRAEVLACFHASGRARGWCARFRLEIDAAAPRPDGWRYTVLAAEPVGTVPEASIMLLPRVGGGGALVHTA